MLVAATHKNVLEFIACFESRSEVIIVTELCAIDMLDRVRKRERERVCEHHELAISHIHTLSPPQLNSHGSYDEAKARVLFVDILMALRHCHELGIGTVSTGIIHAHMHILCSF